MKNFDSLEDTEKDLKRLIEDTVDMALPKLTSQFLTDSNFYIPKDTGDLERNGIENSDFDKGLVVWDGPYAARLFYNPQFNFSKDANPYARGLWAEVAKANNKDKYKDITNEQFEKAKKL